MDGPRHTNRNVLWSFIHLSSRWREALCIRAGGAAHHRPSMTATIADSLHSHAELIRSSGILGRSELLLRLFNFLAQCSVAERTPKELEIALEGFGKRADFDVGQDAMVRVYILKLRRKLDDYYAGAGAAQPQRLVLPKGEYRL